MTFFFLFACATKSSKTESLIDSPQERVSHIQVTELENGDILQQIDLDQDGQTDVWNTLHPRTNSSPILIKQVLDINHDGLGDIWSFYGDDKELIEEHFDMNFDQVIDKKEYYQDGVLISTVIDKDGDGNADIIHRIKNGKLYRSKFDTTGDGKQDLWQALDKEGKVDKYVQDTDGDGIMDKRVE